MRKEYRGRPRNNNPQKFPYEPLVWRPSGTSWLTGSTTTQRQAAAPYATLGSHPNNMVALVPRSKKLALSLLSATKRRGRELDYESSASPGAEVAAPLSCLRGRSFPVSSGRTEQSFYRRVGGRRSCGFFRLQRNIRTRSPASAQSKGWLHIRNSVVRLSEGAQ